MLLVNQLVVMVVLVVFQVEEVDQDLQMVGVDMVQMER